jgi:flagellar assembly factor FliW
VTADAWVTLEHVRFGTLRVPEGEVLHFGGLPGFPGADRFALLRHDRASPFLWLVSLDDPQLCFAVADPRQFFPAYAPVLSAAHLASVQARDERDLELYAIATLRTEGATLNLAAPLLVHAERRRGAQVVLESGDWPLREPLPAPRPPDAARAPAAQIESKPHR